MPQSSGVVTAPTAGVAESQATLAYNFGEPSARNPTSLLGALLRLHSSRPILYVHRTWWTWEDGTKCSNHVPFALAKSGLP
jgi:hypothetical protein